jgi:hypothetical protein
MKFGVREICDVVLKAKATQVVGNKKFYKNEPVIYFDTLKTSSMEGAATTVYAQGGRGNARLIAWEGERTVTFTMEDALISPAGFMILSGAGLIEASASKPIYVHSTEQLVLDTTADTGNAAIVAGDNGSVEITLGEAPAQPNNNEDFIYVMVLDGNGDVNTEPFIATVKSGEGNEKTIVIKTGTVNGRSYTAADIANFKNGSVVLVDFYVSRTGNASQIEITADKFGGNYYLEASTLFRDTNGVDMPAEFIIPNCKIQSNFTFTMASSGDPSTFTFTMDAFPDYTRFDPTKKVLAAIQIVESATDVADEVRASTAADAVVDNG